MNKHYLIVFLLFVSMISGLNAQGFFLVKNLTGPSIQTVDYSPNGKYFANNQFAFGVRIRNATDYLVIGSVKKDVNQPPIPYQSIFALTFSRDSTKFAYNINRLDSSNTRIWTIHPNGLIAINQSIPCPVTWVRDMDFSHDDDRLIRCGDNGFSIYSFTSNTNIITSSSSYGKSYSCKFSKNGDYAVVHANRIIMVYDKNHNYLGNYTGLKVNGYIQGGIDWNKDGTAFAFAQNFKGMHIYNMTTHSASLQFTIAGNQRMGAIDWSPDDSMIAFTVTGNATVIIDAINKKVIDMINLSSSSNQIAFSPDSLYLAEGRISNTTLNIYRICPQATYYEVSNQSCCPCPEGCSKCLNSTNCTKCYAKYIFINASKTCKAECTNISECIDCTNISECIDCSIVSNSLVCLNCSSGYYLRNSSFCDLNCTHNGLSNCQDCSLGHLGMPPQVYAYCTNCSSGHYINITDGLCIANCSSMPQCLKCAFNSSNSLVCSQCTSVSFVNAGGSCTLNCSIVSNCQSCYLMPVSQVICTQCRAIYQVVIGGGSCVLNCTKLEGCLPAQCFQANNTFYCNDCSPLYYLDTGVCKANCSGIDQCVSCAYNSTNQLNCQICSNLSYLNSSKSCPLNCSIINRCINCSSNGANLTCLACITGYYVNNNTCIPDCSNISHCDFCSFNASNQLNCDNCSTNYFVKGSICSLNCSNISNCQACSFNSMSQLVCNVCSTNYYVRNGACYLNCTNVSHCDVCTLGYSNETICTLCLVDYYVNNGTCLLDCLKITGCQSCTLNLTNHLACLNCSNEYYLRNGICILNCSVIDNCTHCYKNISLNQVMCSICAFGYEQVNGTCQLLRCAVKTFLASNNTCGPCANSCSVCNDTTCFACQVGYEVGKGCTETIGCKQLQESYLNTTNNCIDCNNQQGFYLDASNKTCKCPPDYFVNNNICHNIIGCIGPAYIENLTQCTICDFYRHFEIYQHICKCKNGYKLNNQTKKCDQICGDGILFKQECDDGNVYDFDGCSSECKVQKSHKCNGNSTHKSNCLLIAKPILKLKQIYTNRIKLENKGIFKFVFEPQFFFISSSYITDFVFQEKGIQNVSWILSKGLLTVEINYNQTMEREFIKMSFNLHDAYYRGAIFYDRPFTVKTDERELLYSNEERVDFMQILRFIMLIAVGVILLVFTALSCVHKLAGSEFLHVYLIMVYLFILQNKITLFKSFLQLLNYLDIRFMSFVLDYSDDNVNHKLIECMFTAFVYYAIVVLAAILYFIFYVCRKKTNLQSEIADFLIFNKILFPFTLAFFFEVQSATQTSLALYLEGGISYFKPLLFTNIVFYTIAIVILSVEFSNLFLQIIRQAFNYVGLKETKKAYIPLYTSNYFLVVSFLAISRVYQFQYFKQVLFGYVFLILVVFFKKFPYKYNIHNLTVVFNVVVLLVYLGFMIVKEHMPWTVTPFAYFAFLVFMYALLVALNVILNVIRLIIIIKQLCLERKNDMEKMMNEDHQKHKKQQSKYLHKFFYQNHEIIEYKNPLLIPGTPINPLSSEQKQYIKKRKKIFEQEVKLKTYQIYYK